MKKTISITIGKIVFNIEEDAYHNLQEYLSSLKKYFEKKSYGDEIVSDIETRIAEQFNTITKGEARRAITAEEILSVINSIGLIDDFDDSYESFPTESSRKLYRDTDNATIGGVASGIALYFGWDSTVVRILFVIIALMAGWGLVLYIILWIVMPEAKTTSQKMAMQGIPATISNFEKSARNNFEKIKHRGAIYNLFRGLGKVLKKLFGFLAKAVGLTLIVFSSIFIIISTFLLANFLFNPNSPYIDQALAPIFSGFNYYLLVIFSFVALTIPLIFLILGGISLLKKRKVINFFGVCVLAGIWILSSSGATALLFNKVAQTHSIITNFQGEVETRNVTSIDLTKISKIRASGNANIQIRYNPTYSIEIKGFAYQLNDLKIGTDNATLLIENIKTDSRCILCLEGLLSDPDLTITINTPLLPEIEGIDRTRFDVEGFKTNSFSLSLENLSRAELNIESKNTYLTLKDVSRVSLSGSGQNLNASLSNASKLRAFDFNVENVYVKTSDVSRVEINSLKSLKADTSNASKVIYQGDPILDINTSESSSVQKFITGR